MPSELRLLLLTPDFPPARGGIQVLTHRIAEGLAGFTTSVVTLDTQGARTFDEGSRIAVRRVPTSARLGPGRLIPLSVAALEEARRFRPHATLSAHIVTSPAAALIRRALGVPTVQYFYAKEIGAKPKLAAFAARQGHELIAISHYTAQLLADIGVAAERLHLIPPGVDLPADTDPLPAERPTFLTIARLEDRYKGHDVLIRAMPLIRAKVPDAQWVVIGDGPLRSGLERQASSYGVADSVRFLGAVDDEVRNTWLRRAALLAMPSRLPAGGFAGEGFGIVYLEAATYGKPSVAGKVGGALDAVIDDQTGLLVDPTDHVAVAAAVARLLSDVDTARRFGEAGALRATDFAWPAICSRVEDVLISSIGELARGSRRFAAVPEYSDATR